MSDESIKQIQALQTQVGQITSADVPISAPNNPPFDALELWLDANVLWYSNAGSVYYWPDMSGNGYDGTQGTVARQPGMRRGDVNDMGAVRFNGSAFLTNGSAQLSLAEHSAYLVVRETVETNLGGFLSLKPTTGNDFNQPDGIGIISGDAGTHVRVLANSNYLLSAAGSGTTPLAVYHMRKPSNADAGTLYVNGTFADADGAYTALGTFSGGGYALGARWFGGTLQNFLQGDICEILWYGTAHDETTQAAAVSYLRSKWGFPEED